jgi:hypothetical protein
MADVTLSMGVDSAGLDSGIAKAKSTIRSLEETTKKGIFEKLNNDVKNLGGTFSTLRDQLASGNIVGALATVSKGTGSMGMLAPVLGGVGIAMAGVAVAAGGMWSAMSHAKEMRNIADESGLLVSELIPLQKIFNQVGLEADQVPVVMTHLRESLATLNDPASKASKAFEKIGLNAESFKGKSYYEGLKLIGTALANATDKTDALNAATEAFGAKKGTKVGQALAGANFGAMEARNPESAKIIEEQGDIFQRFQLAVARLKPSLDGFFLGMASEIVPALADAADKIERMDLVGLGKRFGDALGAGVNKALELSERLKFVMAVPAERKEMQAAKLKEYEEQRKRQLIPGYAEEQEATKPTLFNYPQISEGPQIKKGAIISTGEEKALKIERPEPILASLAKVGGGASGMGTDSLNIQREQLSVMQQMLSALRSSRETQGRASMIDIYGNSSVAVTA